MKDTNVKVLYDGKLLDGTQFDKNLDVDSPFSFDIGKGMVIKGWDEGICTMKKGEKALFVIHPDMAYGDKDSGKIPPSSVLTFEVTMQDFGKKEPEEPSEPWPSTTEDKLKKSKEK